MSEILVFILELIGTAAFAVSGAIVGIKKQMDLFGVIVLGVCTAVGGGIVRDLILGITPPVTFQNPVYALTAPVIQAATPQAGAPKADKPAKVDARSTPVWVELEGTDSIGARLGMRLKEAFNGSNLFSLTDKDMPKMRLLVSTQSEFPGRPGVGSVYSICWTFTQGEGYLGYLLAREVGTLTYEEIDALVNRLVERTDGLSVKYSNLWK